MTINGYACGKLLHCLTRWTSEMCGKLAFLHVNGLQMVNGLFANIGGKMQRGKNAVVVMDNKSTEKTPCHYSHFHLPFAKVFDCGMD